MIRKIKTFLLNNQTAGQTVAKNTVWLFLGQIMSRLARAAIVVYAARVLGAENWGTFSYALGVATFLTIFSDIGINALLTKESSAKPELQPQLLATAFITKLILLLIVAVVTLLIFPRLTAIEGATALMPILILVFAFDTVRDLGSAATRALQKMEIEASIQFLTNAFIAILGFILLSQNQSSYSLALAYAVGSGLGCLAMLITMRSAFKNVFKNFQTNLIRPIFETAWPFGLLGLMGTIMLNTDIIMIGYLRSSTEVGYYASAQKIIQLFYVLPTILAVSVFPALSRLLQENRSVAKLLLEKYLAIAILSAIPFAVLGIAFGSPLINIIFGHAYDASIGPFKILMITLLIVYPGSLIGHALFAYGAQKRFIQIVIISAFSNVIFNFLLIPRYGINGAALATVFAQLATNIYMWRRMLAIEQLNVWNGLKNIRSGLLNI